MPHSIEKLRLNPVLMEAKATMKGQKVHRKDSTYTDKKDQLKRQKFQTAKRE